MTDAGDVVIHLDSLQSNGEVAQQDSSPQSIQTGQQDHQVPPDNQTGPDVSSLTNSISAGDISNAETGAIAITAEELPTHWEQRRIPGGRPYFVNHEDRTTTWADPRSQEQTQNGTNQRKNWAFNSAVFNVYDYRLDGKGPKRVVAYHRDYLIAKGDDTAALRVIILDVSNYLQGFASTERLRDFTKVRGSLLHGNEVTLDDSMLEPHLNDHYWPDLEPSCLYMSNEEFKLTLCDVFFDKTSTCNHIIACVDMQRGYWFYDDSMIRQIELMLERDYIDWSKDRLGLRREVIEIFVSSFHQRLWKDIGKGLRSFEERFSKKYTKEGTPYRVPKIAMGDRSDQELIHNWEWMQEIITKHRDSYENFLRWSEYYNTKPSQTLMEEATTVMTKANSAEQQMRDRIQVHVSAMSLEESRKAINQSHSLGRLTQLAFLFLPLSFVTGVFGMNIRPFGGDAPTWQFWVTTGTIVAGALLMWWLTSFVDANAGMLTRRWSDSTKFVKDVCRVGLEGARSRRKEEIYQRQRRNARGST